MKTIAILFRFSRLPFVLAVLAATASGIFNSGILMLIHQMLANEALESGRWLVVGFATLCLMVPLSRFGASYMLLRLSQKAVFGLRVELCRKILSAPLQRLEQVGSHRLMAALTGDIGSMATALMDLPLLCMNGAVVLGSLVYLGWLSWQVLAVMAGVILLGIVSYQLPMRWGASKQKLTREVGDVLFEHFKAATEGTKELKLHSRRRQSFLARLTATAAKFRRFNTTAQSIFIAAASLGQAMVFIAVGVVILGVPGVLEIDRDVATGFALVFIYLMAPLQSILDIVPEISQANVAISKVESLGLSLTEDAKEPEDGEDAPEPVGPWQTIELVDVRHSYSESGSTDERSFSLGPIDLELRSGELVFVIGGNGSGKTTFMKLFAGLYIPHSGRILVDGEEVTTETRGAYREMFSTVFSDFYLFKDLLGLEHPELDARALEYLQLLEIDHKVTVEDGQLSTIDLSQGQRKRLALLTAYLEDRSLFLFDEWAADQDPVYKDVFYRQILTGLQQRGKTIVVICHDDRYFDIADRLVQLENGTIVSDRTTENKSRNRLAAPVASASKVTAGA